MSLSCSCDSFDYDESGWFYYSDKDFSVLETKRSRECQSCHKRIKPGDVTLKHDRRRCARDDYEERRFGDGDSVPMVPHYHCEECGGLYLSLLELGFECVSPQERMRTMVQEYAETYGPSSEVNKDER